ncbi:MAG TPA: hypothetical protein VGO11_22170 [Chthoniobacteraceae bacterium]|jgi:hypothetical protein|nr:hypothetical protein [Chthoniobacteraceae bacterium]
MSESTTGKEFSTDPSLRARQVAMLVSKLLLVICVSYVVTRLAAGGLLLPMPIYLFLIALVLPTVLCLGRTAWGNAIRFNEDGIEFLRQGRTIQHIPRASIQSVRPKSNSITLRYTADAASKMKVIGNEGFSKAAWQDLCDYFENYSAASRSGDR